MTPPQTKGIVHSSTSHHQSSISVLDCEVPPQPSLVRFPTILTDEERYYRNFKDVKRVLDQAGIEFWLDYGSLLGAVREGGKIEWDTDLDLSIVEVHWKELLRAIPKLQELGFYGHTTNVPLCKRMFSRRIWFQRYRQRVDIMVYQRVKAEMFGFDWTRRGSQHILDTKYLSKIIRGCYFLLFSEKLFGATHPSQLDVRVSAIYKCFGSLMGLVSLLFGNGKTLVWRLLTVFGTGFVIVRVPSHFFEKLSTTSVFGLTCKTPSDVEEYLTYHYGDWRTPKKQFNWTIDDRAVVGTI